MFYLVGGLQVVHGCGEHQRLSDPAACIIIHSLVVIDLVHLRVRGHHMHC